MYSLKLKIVSLTLNPSSIFDIKKVNCYNRTFLNIFYVLEKGNLFEYLDPLLSQLKLFQCRIFFIFFIWKLSC